MSPAHELGSGPNVTIASFFKADTWQRRALDFIDNAPGGGKDGLTSGQEVRTFVHQNPGFLNFDQVDVLIREVEANVNEGSAIANAAQKWLGNVVARAKFTQYIFWSSKTDLSPKEIIGKPLGYDTPREAERAAEDYWDGHKSGGWTKTGPAQAILKIQDRYVVYRLNHTLVLENDRGEYTSWDGYNSVNGAPVHQIIDGFCSTLSKL